MLSQLSAIIFLTSTWSTTLNVVKTIVIILMLFVFLIASNIADKVSKLIADLPMMEKGIFIFLYR